MVPGKVASGHRPLASLMDVEGTHDHLLKPQGYNWKQQCTLIGPSFRKLKQEDCYEFWANLSDRIRAYLRKTEGWRYSLVGRMLAWHT